MKNKFLSAIAVIALIAFASCSDSSDDYTNANGDTEKKYITSVDYVDTEDVSGSRDLSVNYDASGRVTSASDGVETSYFVYGGGNLTNVTGSSDPLIINDLFQAPYDAYEVGEVLDYDNAGNPVKLRLYARDYDGNQEEFIGEITYDQKPNPYFYTLEAAGIIDVLDNIDLNFSMAPAAPELIKAKMLLPVNNPNKFIVKDMSGQVVSRVVADYVYDNDDYPTSATFTETDENNSTHIYTAVYEYRD